MKGLATGHYRAIMICAGGQAVQSVAISVNQTDHIQVIQRGAVVPGMYSVDIYNNRNRLVKAQKLILQ